MHEKVASASFLGYTSTIYCYEMNVYALRIFIKLHFIKENNSDWRVITEKIHSFCTEKSEQPDIHEVCDN